MNKNKHHSEKKKFKEEEKTSELMFCPNGKSSLLDYSGEKENPNTKEKEKKKEIQKKKKRKNAGTTSILNMIALSPHPCNFSRAKP